MVFVAGNNPLTQKGYKMIVTETTQNVTSVNTGVEHTAKIKASPKAFQVLSGSLYSNPILAVVRELSCNAYDAHVAAGNVGVPFELKLPTSWDNTFYVKDFGTGIAEEDVYDMYMTYFESTKTESDDFIGQLGLGCKSPFSYGVPFTIESRQDGVKKTYTAYKNEKLEPSVALMDASETDEPNGLTVSLPVRPEDIYKFQTAAKYALMYLDVKPTIAGITDFGIHKVEYVREGVDCKVRSPDSVYSGPRVIQGSVSYPIDIRTLKEALHNKADIDALDLFETMPLDLFVPIGQVNIAPSREALNYDLRTAQNLYKILNAAYSNFYKDLQTEFDACATRWEAVIKYDGMRVDHQTRTMVDRYQQHLGKFTYNGLELDSDPYIGEEGEWAPKTIEVLTIVGTNRAHKRATVNGQYQFDHANFESFTIRPNAKSVVVIDKNGNERTRNRKLGPYLWSGGFRPQYNKAIVISPTTSKEDLDMTEVQQMLELLGNPPTVDLDTIPSPVAETTYKYKPKKLDELMVFQDINHNRGWKTPLFGTKSWKTVQCDLSAGGFYLDIDRYTVVTPGFQSEELPNIIRHAKALGFIPADAFVVGLNAKKKDQVVKEGPWVNLIDHVKDALDDFLEVNDCDAMVEASSVTSWARGEHALQCILENWTTDYDTTKNVELLDLHARWTAAAEVDQTLVSAIKSLVGSLNVPTSFKSMYEVTEGLGEIWAEARRGCDTLTFISIPAASRDPKGRALLVTALTR